MRETPDGPGRNRGRGRGRSRERDRYRERIRRGVKSTEEIREGAEKLDIAPEEVSIGDVPAGWDEHRENASEGDDWLEDEPEDDEEDADEATEAGYEETSQDDGPLALADLLGSRPPRVHVRLVRCASGELRVEPCVEGRDEATRAALRDACQKLEYCFTAPAHQKKLNHEDWARLLGESPASLLSRFLLLQRLAIGSGQVAEGQKAAKDVGASHYEARYALLPDGTPFSLGLLLYGAESAGRTLMLTDLPAAARLLLIGRALRSEQEGGDALSDFEFGKLLCEAARTLGLGTLSRPTDRQVSTLRNTFLKRMGLAHLFPKRNARQEQYTAEASNCQEDSARERT